MSGSDDELDLLAAEFVLGVLEGAERAEVARRADRDEALSRAIDTWEIRLAPLAAVVPAVTPPPELWSRVESSCGLTTAPLGAASARQEAARRRGFWNGLGFWRGMTALGFGLAAAVAVVAVVNRPVPPPTGGVPIASAVLSPSSGKGPAGFVAEAAPDKTIVLRPLERLAVASGKDLELWALTDGASVPQALGVVSDKVQRVKLPGSVKAPMQLMVSLEQKGGSPTGLPQGPVLWKGHIAALE